MVCKFVRVLQGATVEPLHIIIGAARSAPGGSIQALNSTLDIQDLPDDLLNVIAQAVRSRDRCAPPLAAHILFSLRSAESLRRRRAEADILADICIIETVASFLKYALPPVITRLSGFEVAF